VCGDTWASELGILSLHPPRLATTCCTRRVPRGTNGGMSAWGTMMSALGGLFMGAVMLVDQAVAAAWGGAAGFGDESAQGSWGGARTCMVGGTVRAPPQPQLLLLPIGLAAGLAGSIIDSLLGGTVQRSWYDPVSGRATATLESGVRESARPYAESMVDDAEERLRRARREVGGKSGGGAAKTEEGEGGEVGKEPSSGSARRRAAAVTASPSVAAAAAGMPRELVVVCGYPLLSNEAVNLVSSGLTAGLTAWAGMQVFEAWGSS
jgi:uncharacterized membrane protein